MATRLFLISLLVTALSCRGGWFFVTATSVTSRPESEQRERAPSTAARIFRSLSAIAVTVF